jgi:flavorubredoxin
VVGPFNAVKIAPTVYWVGAIDWGLRDFHGYATSRGSSYNAYLILADKITLVDTVKAPFKNELLARISSVIDPGRIDYIISNHAEMDHSGCLPEIIERVNPEKVFASRMGRKALNQHFDLGDRVSEVPDGEQLSLGNRMLTFLETRMLHWPDSMVSFLDEDGILFSQDGFGMHLAMGELFADKNDLHVLEHETAKYYANILLPFSTQTLKVLEKIKESGWQISMIAPDHGPIWRKDLDTVLGWYETWAAQKPTKKAVIVYDTMWNSTGRMANALADGLMSDGAVPKIMPLAGSHRSDVATETLDAGALIVGTPTINNNMFPSVADILTYLKGLKPRNLIGAAFGSYGWSGEATGQVEAVLKEMKVEIVHDAVRVNYVPTAEDLENCQKLGGLIAARLHEVAESSS